MVTETEVTEESQEVNDLLIGYIVVLLDRYDECLNEGVDEPDEAIGQITILVDDGTVGARLNERHEEKNGGLQTFLLCMPTFWDAKSIEYLLAQWAVDNDTLADIVRLLRPDYPDAEYYDTYIEQAVDEIACVFLNTIIIPPGSFMDIQLRNASIVSGCC